MCKQRWREWVSAAAGGVESYILNCLAFEGYEKGELVALRDFPEVEEAPSTPHISLDEASDHGTWMWENKELLEALTRQVLWAKGTQASGPKLLFSCPSLCLPLPSMICTHKTPLQAQGLPQLADLLDCSLTSPAVCSGHRQGLPCSGKWLQSCG